MKKKSRLSNTAQVNLLMLADLGIPEAVHFQKVLQFSHGVLNALKAVPMASALPVCISMISEILYQRTNEILEELDYPLVLDLACGYSPRVLRISDLSHTYVGVDLPDVVSVLKEHREELTSYLGEEAFEYYSVDLTDFEAFAVMMKELKGNVSVITQGLLTYLTLDQKQVLMKNIRSVLEQNGGCWIIPDAAPDRLLPDVFSAVLGANAYSVFKDVMAVVDRVCKRDRNKNGWKTTGEIVRDLESFGFEIKRVPLYSDSLKLESLNQLTPGQKEEVISNWKTTDVLLVTLPERGYDKAHRE